MLMKLTLILGFGIENKKEFMLGGNDDFKLSIDDKDEDLDNIEDENIDDIDLEEISLLKILIT